MPREYRRDGEPHLVRGAGGHALAYRFDPPPEPEDMEEDPEGRRLSIVSDSYLRNNGLAVSDITPLAGLGFPADERYSIQTVSISFKDLLSPDVLRAIRSVSGPDIPKDVSDFELTNLAGRGLLDIGLALISYGFYGYEETTAATKNEAVHTATRGVES